MRRSNAQRKAMFARMKQNKNDGSESNKLKSRNVQIKEKYNKFGYLREVRNPQGTKGAVVMGLSRDGWIVTRPRSDEVIKTVQNPEKSARQLAKQGYESVTILD